MYFSKYKCKILYLQLLQLQLIFKAIRKFSTKKESFNLQCSITKHIFIIHVINVNNDLILFYRI